MWGTVMAINSFFVWPASAIFLIFAIGRAFVVYEWKMAVIALIIFAITSIAQLVLGILSE
jgi:hypothetical protein